MNTHVRQHNSPWNSLIVLLGLTLVASFVIQFTVLLIDTFIHAGISGLTDVTVLSTGYMDRPSSLYLILASSTFSTFCLPPLILQRLEKYYTYFPVQRSGGTLRYLIVLLFLCVSSPLMQVVGEWNANMTLPESLGGVQQWMRQQEDNMALLTKNIVMVDTIPLLLTNILVMAVLPAIGEELFFRGSLMHIVQRMTKNVHLTIWIVAIVFSAIHVQFYGFFPRLLLGAFFGYMFVWTKNIWVPIFGHFVNNAFVAILAFYYAKQGKTYEELQTYEGYPLMLYIGSFILTGLVGYWFYDQTHKKQKN